MIHQARQFLRRALVPRERIKTPRGNGGAERADGGDEVRGDCRLVRVRVRVVGRRAVCFGFFLPFVGGHGDGGLRVLLDTRALSVC